MAKKITPSPSCFSTVSIEEGQRFGAPLLLTHALAELMQAAYERGYGEKDTVYFIEILRGMAGLAPRDGIDDEPIGKH